MKKKTNVKVIQQSPIPENIPDKHEEAQEGVVTISKKMFDDLMAKIEMLEETTDKRRMSLYKMRHAQKLPTSIKLRTLYGKVIVGWKTVEDLGSFKDPKTGVWTERQIIKLLFADGTDQTLNYLEYVRAFEKVNCKIISTTENKERGLVAHKVERLDNGKQYDIAVQYLN